MSKQHKIIIETENKEVADLIVRLFASGELTKAITDSEEYHRLKADEKIVEVAEETEVYFDDYHRDYRQHKVQISTI